MNFQDFVSINEFSDIANLNTNDIILKKKSNGYYYQFPLDEDDFEIYFNFAALFIEKDEYEYLELIKSSDRLFYSIGLKANGDYDLTKKGRAFTVYSKLFAVCKKFIDTVPFEGLVFGAFEQEMELVYNKFYQKYLSNFLMRLDSERYIKKTFYAKLPPYEKQMVDNHINKSLPSHVEKLKNIRQFKIANRKELLGQQEKSKANYDHEDLDLH